MPHSAHADQHRAAAGRCCMSVPLSIWSSLPDRAQASCAAGGSANAVSACSASMNAVTALVMAANFLWSRSLK